MSNEQASDTIFARISASFPYLMTGLSVMVLLGAAGFLAWQVFGPDRGANETLRFIALLIMFMVALAATASLFVSLRMGNPGEAFGLPSGSIRALLALGIMMLFVVFGMPVISTSGDAVQPIDAQVAPAQLADTVRGYREQGFTVVITNPGTPTVPTTLTQTGSPGQNATIKILGRLPTQSAAQLDLTKQLLTAIITLLTTVIGFYFGSRSSTDAIREGAVDPMRPGTPEAGSPGSRAPAPPAASPPVAPPPPRAAPTA